MGLELLRSVTGKIKVESHRGCDLFPENSWPAIEAAHQLGADFIEVDVQLSKDDIAFLRHKYTVPDGRWCHSLIWSELKTITVSGEQFPLLEDVLSWSRSVGAFLSLDLKSGFLPEGYLCREIISLLERTKALESVSLISWDHVELKWAKQVHPELTTRALVRARPADLQGMLKAASVDAISLSYDLVRPSDIEQAHALGIAVALVEMWQPDFDLAKNLGVDIVSWGNPKEAKEHLA